MTRSEALNRIYADIYSDTAADGETPDICAYTASRCRAFYADCSNRVLEGVIEDHTGIRPSITGGR